MFSLLLILLLKLDISYDLKCITNCSLGNHRFGQTFKIPDGQCQERNSGLACSIDMTFDYHENLYYVSFDILMVSADHYYISSTPYFSYSIKYQCSKGTDCVLSYAQKRIDEMVSRGYNARTIYRQLAPIIENPSRNGSIQCYDMRNEIVVYSYKQICSIVYDQRSNSIRSRGCQQNTTPKVFVYDGKGHATFDVECSRNLCNTDDIISQIKIVFNNNGLTDANGRRVAVGNKQIISSLLMTLALIFIAVYYF